MSTCNISVKQFNLNAKITLFNRSMFYRFHCQTSVTRCRFHTKRKQEVENVLLRSLPIINLKLLAAEGHIKTFAFSRKYQVWLQNAIQCWLSFIVYFVCKSRFHSLPWIYNTVPQQGPEWVVLQTGDHFNTSEVWSLVCSICQWSQVESKQSQSKPPSMQLPAYTSGWMMNREP